MESTYNSFCSCLWTDYYNKAVIVAPRSCRDFDGDVAQGDCWNQNHLRSYFRAVHGQANTLRKMGRNKEALEKYVKLQQLDSNFYRYNGIGINYGDYDYDDYDYDYYYYYNHYY